jgi:branched-chain amino acid transport system ATP-binding protein
MAKELSKALRAIRADDTAILLVEQNAAMVLRLASRGYLLETGICVADGPTGDLLANDYVRKAYLGFSRRPTGSAVSCHCVAHRAHSE